MLSTIPGTQAIYCHNVAEDLQSQLTKLKKQYQRVLRRYSMRVQRYKQEYRDGRRPVFVVEDSVWWLPPGASFAVLATIIGVRRSVGEGSTYFYEIDEPVGHDLPAEELCPQNERGWIREALAEHVKDFPDGLNDIYAWRKRSVDFIYSTHVKSYGDKVERYPWLREDYYPKRSKDEILK